MSLGGSGRHRPKPAGSFHVARSRDTVYVRVIGMGTMNNSATLEGFVLQMVDKGYRRLVCDLTECRGVDSTFMGVLAGVKGDVDGLVLVNPSPHCLKQLRSVGLDHLLAIEDRPDGIPDGVVLAELPSHEQNPAERMKLIVRAHQELIRADKRNEEKFGAFLRDVLGNLDRSRPAGGPS